MKVPGDFEPLRPADLVKGIPDYRQVELQDVRSAGGTSGARVAEDAEGNEWIIKHYSGETDRVGGTVAACLAASRRGASAVRVHDVAPVFQAMEVEGEIATAGRAGDDSEPASG